MSIPKAGEQLSDGPNTSEALRFEENPLRVLGIIAVCVTFTDDLGP